MSVVVICKVTDGHLCPRSFAEYDGQLILVQKC